jgi:hypothetical protein
MVTVTTNPTVTATGTTTICEGESTPILASGGTTYAWDNGAGTNALATVSPMTTTTYTVTGTINGCSATDAVTVTVSPIPTVTIEPAVIDTLCVTSDPITLVGTPGGGTFSGTGVSGSVFNPAIGLGTYTITYSYTNASGCTGEILVNVVVDPCTNNVTEMGLIGVSLFPNPNEGVFMITGLNIGTEYEIYDDRGRLVSSGTTESDKEEVQLIDVQTGIYYLYATQNGEKGSLKFLITK